MRSRREQRKKEVEWITKWFADHGGITLPRAALIYNRADTFWALRDMYSAWLEREKPAFPVKLLMQKLIGFKYDLDIEEVQQVTTTGKLPYMVKYFDHDKMKRRAIRRWKKTEYHGQPPLSNIAKLHMKRLAYNRVRKRSMIGSFPPRNKTYNKGPLGLFKNKDGQEYIRV